MMRVIAKTIVYAEPAVSSAGLSASDVVAICSLVVAALAFGFSVVSAEVQRRHNVRVARPHLDLVLGLSSSILSVINHGPGVARLISFSATAENRHFDLVSETGLREFCLWLNLAGGRQRDEIQILVTTSKSYIAPNLTKRIIGIPFVLDRTRETSVEQRLSSVVFEISYSSIYEKVYTDTHGPYRPSAS